METLLLRKRLHHQQNDSGPSPINHNKHHLPRVQDDPIRNAKSRISETATAITSTTQKRDAFGSLHALAKAALSINTERTPPLPTRTDLSITRTTPLPTSPIKAHPIARSKTPLAQILLLDCILLQHSRKSTSWENGPGVTVQAPFNRNGKRERRGDWSRTNGVRLGGEKRTQKNTTATDPPPPSLWAR